MVKLVCLWIAILLSDYRSIEAGNTSCIEGYQCIPIKQCRTVASILYPCREDQAYVCCSTEHKRNNTNDPSLVLRTSAFPDVCGLFLTSDRITGGEVAAIGQFPWMALLGYKLDFVQFLCGGSLITQEYVLTAAHCISIDARLKLFSVRFGELNLETEEDCEQETNSTKFCADPPVDVLVDSTTPHENFNTKTLENDIALVKLKRKVSFTDFIQPICLPFKNDINDDVKINGKLTVSGWGKTDSSNVGGSSILQYAQVTVWDQGKCNTSIPPRIRPIRESQLCANGIRKQDACKGDSGGPLFNSTLINNDYKYYQIGIVSFSSAQVCGNIELPTIYTRIESFLKWIVINVVQTN